MGLVALKTKCDHLWERIRDFRAHYFDYADESTQDAYFRAVGRGQFAGTAWDMGLFEICEEYVDDALEFISICFAVHGEFLDEPVSSIDSQASAVL